MSLLSHLYQHRSEPVADAPTAIDLEQSKKDRRAAYLAKPIVGKFRVLRGSHNEGGKTYHRGDVVESRVDLVKKFNEKGIPPRFSRITGREVKETTDPGPSTSDQKPNDPALNPSNRFGVETLKMMNLTELKGLAAEEEIDLGGATKKDEIIAILMSAQ